MSGLNERDMEVLRHYAERGNRELYWNYLARRPDNDGYGVLALGVVRNDNMPGAVANAYAQNYAQSNDGRRPSEREWERFGEDLVRRDLERREAHMRGGREDLALNLPVADVQRAHDDAFRGMRVSPNAWTPRELLEAARRQGGEQAAEGVWERMLDNAVRGAQRGLFTAVDIARYDDSRLDAIPYTGRLASAYASAAQMRSNVDPDVIGGATRYHMRERDTGDWWSVSAGGMMGAPVMRRETNPRTIEELDDARTVRLERQADRQRFHQSDDDRTIVRSPRTLADAQTPEVGTRHAALDTTPRASAEPGRETRAADPHGIDLLPPAARERHAEALTHARRLGLPEEDTHNIAMAMTRRVGDNPTMRNIDDIVAVRGGADDGGVRVHMMYKPYGDKPPVFNDYVDMHQAAALPAREQAQGIAQIEQQRIAQAQSQPQPDERLQQRSGLQQG